MKNKEIEYLVNLIGKYFEGTEDDDTVVFYDGERITEIDTESKEILYGDGDTLSFNEIDEEFIKVFYVQEFEMYDDVSSYIKDVKKSKKSLENYNNVNMKKLTLFKHDENFVTSLELLDKFLIIDFIVDNFYKLELFELTLIKNPKV